MGLKSLLFALPVSLALFSEASAQISCWMSNYPYGESGRPRMHGNDFKAVSNDLPFIAHDEHRLRYSQFWVSADVLNIRSGPDLTHSVISEIYQGNLVFAYAKKGDWVAIRPEYAQPEQDIYIPPRWVHKNYLSALTIDAQVDTDVLKGKCSFTAYGRYYHKIRKRSKKRPNELARVYDACTAVRAYLNEQQLLGQPHDYVHDYETWRRSQNNPDEFSPAPCYRPK